MTPEEMVARLLYRDGLMLVIDKPAGYAVHKGPKGGESLEDHFGAQSPLEDELLHAFQRGRARIRSVCAEALDQNDGASVVLRSGLFRVEGMEPDRGVKT